jgi:Tat protein translocase TatB subunit
VFGIQGGEFIVLLVVALLVIGPERLPEYSAKLAKLVRQLRGLADTAKVQLREQMGRTSTTSTGSSTTLVSTTLAGSFARPLGRGVRR